MLHYILAIITEGRWDETDHCPLHLNTEGIETTMVSFVRANRIFRYNHDTFNKVAGEFFGNRKYWFFFGYFFFYLPEIFCWCLSFLFFFFAINSLPTICIRESWIPRISFDRLLYAGNIRSIGAAKWQLITLLIYFIFFTIIWWMNIVLAFIYAMVAIRPL